MAKAVRMKDGTAIGKREFEVFKSECFRWVKRLGLSDWKLHFAFEEVENGLASINTDFEGKIARVSLNPFQERVPKREVNVKSSARHEMLHLLLSELRWMNSRRFITDNSWEAAEHAVIRRLENALK
jgi:hypothetical protein